MDSVKNEGPTAIIVGDIVVAPTNGINGVNSKHDETSAGAGGENMKTRSKMVDGEGANPAAQKRAARAVKNDDKAADAKGSGKTAADTKAAVKDAATAGAKASQSGGGAASTMTSKKTKLDEALPPAAAAKKKTNDGGDDDSGVNSRASSVSNDDIVTPPRMRTRSSKITTSTPTSSYKKGQERLPLSSYQVDGLIEEDELMALNSLKRKAVVYVEEMEDEDAERPEKEPSGEPLAKRAFRSIGHVGSTLASPFRALGGRLQLRRGAAAAAAPVADEQQQNNGDSADDKQAEMAAEQPPAVAADGQQNTCILIPNEVYESRITTPVQSFTFDSQRRATMTTLFQENRFKLPTNGVAVNEQLGANCDKLKSGGPIATAKQSSTAAAHLAQQNLMIREEIVEEEILEVDAALLAAGDDDDCGADDNVGVGAEAKNDADDSGKDAAKEKRPAKSALGPPEPVINNVVCSFSVGCHLNLRQIATLGIHVEFRRESGMVTMKLRKPRVTASIWSSGKITCTGATSENDAKIGARRVARVIQKLGFQAKFRRMRIVNVLGCCSMPFGIKINAFSQEHRDAEYEPELHPGVTYKIKELKATLKIFSTGSITVTAPCVDNVRTAIKRIYPLVYEFRKEFTKDELLMSGATGRRAAAARLEDKKRRRLNSDNSRSSDEDSIM